MKKIILFFLLLVFNFKFCFSIDTASIKYYPMNTGNTWVYVHMHFGYPSETYKTKSTITGGLLINGHVYHLLSTSGFIRIDSAYGRLLQYTSNGGCLWLNNETLIDSISSKQSDSCKANCYIDSAFKKCTDTTIQLIFGIMRPSKTFTRFYFEHEDDIRYVRGIGPAYHYLHMGGPYYYWDTLQGCVINGVVYGDTSITGIQPISYEIPFQFNLYQNYPNPFNPTTKIKFEVPVSQGGGVVRLSIYDLLGNEVTTLVNGKLSPGTYEAEWDASNNSSGVYFYTISAESYHQTKRMVLLK